MQLFWKETSFARYQEKTLFFLNITRDGKLSHFESPPPRCCCSSSCLVGGGQPRSLTLAGLNGSSWELGKKEEGGKDREGVISPNVSHFLVLFECFRARLLWINTKIRIIFLQDVKLSRKYDNFFDALINRLLFIFVLFAFSYHGWSQSASRRKGEGERKSRK